MRFRRPFTTPNRRADGLTECDPCTRLLLGLCWWEDTDKNDGVPPFLCAADALGTGDHQCRSRIASSCSNCSEERSDPLTSSQKNVALRRSTTSSIGWQQKHCGPGSGSTQPLKSRPSSTSSLWLDLPALGVMRMGPRVVVGDDAMPARAASCSADVQRYAALCRTSSPMLVMRCAPKWCPASTAVPDGSCANRPRLLNIALTSPVPASIDILPKPPTADE